MAALEGSAAPAAASHRLLHVLTAGILLGILMGPGVMGRVAPDVYTRFFPDWRRAQAELLVFEREQAVLLERLSATGASEAARTEFDQLHGNEERLQRVKALARGRRQIGHLHALVVAVVAIMVVETLLADRSPWLRRLATCRYGLMAIWIALLIAQPHLIVDVPFGLAALLMVVALGAAWVPLPRRRASGA